MTRHVLLEMPFGRRKLVTVQREQRDYRMLRPRPFTVWFHDDDTLPVRTPLAIDVYEPTGEYEYTLRPTGVSAVEIWRVQT